MTVLEEEVDEEQIEIALLKYENEFNDLMELEEARQDYEDTFCNHTDYIIMKMKDGEPNG